MRTPWCRVLLVEPSLVEGGAQRAILRLAEPLARAGVTQILAAPADSVISRQWRAAGRPHVRYEPAALRGIRRAGGWVSVISAGREAGRTLAGGIRLARLARQTRSDVIYANGHWSHLEVALAGRLSGRPSLLHLHDLSQPDALGRLRAIAVRTSGLTVAVSKAVVRSLPAGARERVQVIGNGIDVGEYAPGPAQPRVRAALAADPTLPVVLVVARVEPAKGILDVIRAVHALGPGAASVAVAGEIADPGYAEHLRTVGDQLLGSGLRLLGPRQDVADLMRAADLLVLASRGEGLPLSVLEAQACGLPVVGYPAGGTAEVVQHGVTGLLAAQSDINDLSRQIAAGLHEESLVATLVANARRQVCADATIARQADALAAALRTLIKRRV